MSDQPNATPGSDADAVRVIEDGDAHRYNVLLGERTAGFVTYRLRGEQRVLVHTEVDPDVEGRGIGSRLVEGVLEDLRTRGLRAIVMCPFITDYLERHPEYGDVVEPRA